MNKPLAPYTQLALGLPRIQFSETALNLPDDLAFEDWRELGIRLGRAETGINWWIGDWWNAGHRYGERKAIVESADWQGPTWKTAHNCGTVATAFGSARRRALLPFTHHAEVAALDSDEADNLLDEAEHEEWSASELRGAVKRKRRTERERDLAAKILALPDKRYGIALVDPPWRFEPYSRETGMDRAADNHYPTMTVDKLRELVIPAADDAALFVWVTVPFEHIGHELIDIWGFKYKSQFVWVKDDFATGYWNRNQHELLLIATQGDIPAPAPGDQFPSVIMAPATEHSVKPERAYEIIESYFPTLPKLELFARAERPGWDRWGLEA